MLPKDKGKAQDKTKAQGTSKAKVQATAADAIKAAGVFEPPPLLPAEARRFVIATCDEGRDFTLLDEVNGAGLAAYAPEIRLVISSARRGFRVARRPLFPGYVFIAAADAAPRIELLEGLKGFAGLVRAGDRPALLPRDLVDAIWLEQAGGHWDCRVPPARRGRLLHPGRPAAGMLQPGDRVEIGSGSFAGFIGLVERVDGQGRVSLLIDLLGRLTRAELGLEHVRAA